MAKLLIAIVLAATVNSLEWSGSNKNSFWSYYEAVGDFIKTNSVATYAKESLEDLHEYLVEEDVYGKAFKIAHDIKDYTADSVIKLQKHGESLSSELKNVATEYYREAKTSAKEFYEISKKSASNLKDYAKESLEDLHEYLVEEDVYGKAFKIAHDIKDYTADSVKKLQKHGESLSSELKNVATEYYREAKTSAKEFYEISKESASNLKDYAQKSAYKFGEYSSNIIHDLYKDSRRLTYEFIEFAKAYTKNPINNFLEYVTEALRDIQEWDYYKAAKKATIDFIEYAKHHRYTRLTADNLEYSFGIISGVYEQAKESINNKSYYQVLEDNSKLLYEFIMDDIVSNAIENFEYIVDIIKETLGYYLPGLRYQTFVLNKEADNLVIYNMPDEELNFRNINKSYMDDHIKCIGRLPEASHIESCKTKSSGNISQSIFQSYYLASAYTEYSYIYTILPLYMDPIAYIQSLHSLIYNLFHEVGFKLSSLMLSLYENLSYESIVLAIFRNYEDIRNIYQTHSFKDALIIYFKRFKNLSNRTLTSFIKMIGDVLMIELPTTYIDRLISLISRFDYLKLYRLLKDTPKYIFNKYDIDLNKSPLNYLVNASDLLIQGGISKMFSKLGMDFIKEKLEINVSSWFHRYMSKILNKISKSGVYSGSKEVLNIVSRALSYGLEVISIDRLSDILAVINRDDEFYGLNKINPFDILIPCITLALSAYTFDASLTLSFSVAQLVSEVISSIIFPQPKPPLEVCDYKDHIIHHLLYYEKSHCLPKSLHKSSKSTRCSDYLKIVLNRFHRVYKDVSKHKYYQLPLDLVDSILDSDTYYSECF
jgi:hypothetical protein